jgi:hypothetical protein
MNEQTKMTAVEKGKRALVVLMIKCIIVTVEDAGSRSGGLGVEVMAVPCGYDNIVDFSNSVKMIHGATAD